MNPKVEVSEAEIKNLLTTTSAHQTLAGALTSITGPKQLLTIINEYVAFNAPFGAGVASLSGSIGARSIEDRVFLDPDPEFPDLNDASYEVAAAVFEAAIAEFDGGGNGKFTHRTLALATVKAIAKTLDITEVEDPRESTCEATRMIVRGYGISRALDDQDLFRAIGFHIGSEILADIEMNELDDYLRNSWPSIIEQVAQKPTSVILRGKAIPAYAWVEIHCSVETEHYEAALRAANLALKFYSGDKNAAKLWILDGFQNFYNLQQKFLSGLL